MAARRHPIYAAFVVHRVSGLALALFLPLHFTLLATALGGAGALDAALKWTDRPLVHVAEWGLVVLLSLHLAAGLRLLLIEFGDWAGPRKNWIAGGCGFALATGLAYALLLWH
ncbi:MAG: succinate dehydrogenase [Burkholderiales bacterium]|nr:succinate dehydrogenase [Burkholderiales bacterium]MDE1926499.1 succinate dehydrogenase [Burkholderiales bacterium]MDE2159969.1 succinate dehydrogenase [Burkholderiales bacterium]MDE2501905.1 succinate dehydrogenase [Burkholderiales bacterium]